MPIRIILADDHPIILDGLQQLFASQADFEVIARCGDGSAALDLVHSLAPDLLLLDIRMPGMDGISVLQAIRSEHLPTRVVLLTAGLDDPSLAQALRLRAEGLVLKETPPRELVECVRRVAHGEQCWTGFDAEAALRRMVDEQQQARSVSALTTREIEIARMVAQGLRNKEIATRLSITEGTVKFHLHSIYEKLQIDGRVALTLFVREHGMG